MTTNMKKGIAVILLCCLLPTALVACDLDDFLGNPDPIIETSAETVPESTEPDSEPAGEAASETLSETTADEDTETSTEAPTEAPTEEQTETVTEVTTEAPTEAESISIEELMKMDEVTDVTIPNDSKTVSAVFANQMLSLASGYNKSGTAAVFEHAGFTVLTQVNFDKPSDSAAHTSAFTIGKKTVTYQGETRTVILTAVRGTDGGEWLSNFDVLPNRNYDTAVFAENFLLSAQNVYETLKPILESETNPLVLICGHSRGAATANLLGMLVNADFGTKNVFTYTFATPATVCGTVETDCSNIFNYINPCDVVTKVPLETWNFRRVGTDIILPANETDLARVNGSMSTLSAICSNITTYYEDKHSLTAQGLSEDGVSTFEVMSMFGKMLGSGTLGLNISQEDLMNSMDMRFVFMSSQSDLYPLMQIMLGLAQDGGAGMLRIAVNHLPSTYQKLIKTLN